MRKFGLRDFWDFARKEDLCYSIFAIPSSLEQVSQAVMEHYGRKDIVADVLSDEYVASPSILCEAIPVVAVKNSPWTLIYRSLHRNDGMSDAQGLSASLQVRVMHFLGEMDSEFMAYEIIEDGQVVEKMQFNGLLANSPFTFDSQLRTAPQLDWLDVDEVYRNQQVFQGFVNDFCQEQKLYVPACNKYVLPRMDLRYPSPLLLRVPACSKGKIQTANFVGDVVSLEKRDAPV